MAILCTAIVLRPPVRARMRAIVDRTDSNHTVTFTVRQNNVLEKRFRKQRLSVIEHIEIEYIAPFVTYTLICSSLEDNFQLKGNSLLKSKKSMFCSQNESVRLSDVTLNLL